MTPQSPTIIPEEKILPALDRFTAWLETFGETSHDYQTFYASPIGKAAKRLYYEKRVLGTLAVAPMVFCEALWPRARAAFWKKMRFAIADAHFAMGFACLYRTTRRQGDYEKARHYIEALKETRSPGYARYCWGYPFDWVTKTGTFEAGTPYITTLPYIYEALDAVYEIDRDEQWLDVMSSIAEHAARDIRDFEVSPGAASAGYSPVDTVGGVVNASAYRAVLLTLASRRFGNDAYRKIADGNIQFVLNEQQADGSWYYATTKERTFVDHYHTCFVLKALTKIERATGHPGCRAAIEKGIPFYVKALFDEKGLPKPFAKAPRLTVYRKELYDYAECINLGLLLKGRFPDLDEKVARTVADVLTRWQKKDGSFHSRRLYLGWDDVPMHRWGQSQIFRSLSCLLCSPGEKDHNMSPQGF